MAQKERIDKMTLDQYLQSPQMTAEEILYARQVKFASYTEARKDVFPTFVAELSGWNNIQRLKDGIDPTTGEQANRWFAAGELSLDLASNLLPFLKAGKITQLGKILDATDDLVDTFDYVSDVAKTTDKLDDVGDGARVVRSGGTNSIKNPLENIEYTDKVKMQMMQGDFHSFPESVDSFGSDGKVTEIIGGDGVVRTKVEISGSYKSRDGIFEYIIEPDNTVNHRFFRPTN
ncbi:hypothetical protein [Streptococcus suis]